MSLFNSRYLKKQVHILIDQVFVCLFVVGDAFIDFELFYIFLMAKELRAIKYLHCTVLTQKGLKMILGLFVLTPNIQGILLLLHPWPFDKP